MPRRLLERIRDTILGGEYDLTRHAIDEMAEDGLGIFDVESAILGGAITKTALDDPRGPRYTIVGPAEDKATEVGVVGRFTETGIYLIITVYEVIEPEGW
jgi:hypothetical protein